MKLGGLLGLGLPAIFGIVVGVATLVAVALVLYFMVFKKKMAAKSVQSKEKRAAKQEQYQASTSAAANIFQEKQSEPVNHNKAADMEELERRVNLNTNAGVADLKLEKPKPPKAPKAPKPKPVEEPKEPEITFDVNAQFKGGK